MSLPLVIAPAGRADLAEIRDYLDQQASTQTAARVLIALWNAMSDLAAGTAVGHSRLDLAPDPIRFYLVFRYLIVYQLGATELVVSRVLHSARDVRAILG